MKNSNLQTKTRMCFALFVFLLGTVGMSKGYAQMFTVDNLNYTVNYGSNTVTLKGHVDGIAATGTLVIPSTITHDGTTYTVTMIAREAFKDCRSLTGSLVIPNTVTAMGDDAFSGCEGFTGSLTIGDALTAIPEHAFYNCTGFHGTLTIGNAVTTIGDYAFQNCSGFTGDLTIPNSVMRIGYNAFSRCESFNGRLVLPSTMEKIDDGAFEYCSGLTGELILPSTYQDGSLGHMAFCECSGFTGNLVIPSSIDYIGSGAFAGCSGFNGTLTLSNSIYRIFTGAFNGCSGFIGDLILPDVDIIEDYVFANCSGFNGNLLIPESVNLIFPGAFYNCSGLSSITVCNNNPPEIDDWDDIHAFDGVNKNIPVYIPCNTAPQYQIASYWDEFYNYHETFLNTIQLDVYADDEEHCTVSIEQMPTSCESSLATVKAIPAEGYSFVAWKEWNDDTYEYDTVSTEAVYSFNLEYDRYLVACVKSNTGLSEDSDLEIKMYPNPANGLVIIEAEDFKHISINNLHGQQIYQGEVNSNTFIYDFDKHGAGLYLIRIETASGVATKRVAVTQ